MKIDKGGTPIWISRRRIGGAEIIQGTSRIKLTEQEIPELKRILDEISKDAHEGKRKMTDIDQYQ